jgi:hypothetical protein
MKSNQLKMELLNLKIPQVNSLKNLNLNSNIKFQFMSKSIEYLKHYKETQSFIFLLPTKIQQKMMRV